MDRFKRYVTENFEQAFVLLVLVSVAFINYFVPYKLIFINVYFLPVLFAAHYLGLRKALLGGILCVIMVCFYAWQFPENFSLGAGRLDLAMALTVWASFLILTGAVVGLQQEKLRRETTASRHLTEDLGQSQSLLVSVQRELQEHSENLESKVAERTEVLEKSKHAVEELKQKVEDALYSTMDPAVVKLIIERRLRTEKRRVSVLFSDLKAFTQYSEERGPDVVVTDLNRFLGDMEETLLQYRGHIDKYMGDGVMVEFGAPIPYERHALMAVLAALKMQERLARGGYPWPMRVGIATGETIIGLIGRRRQSYTAIGDTVNVASRIQESCEPGRVTVDGYTHEAVRPFVESQPKSLMALVPGVDPGAAREANQLAEAVERAPNDLAALRRLGMLLHGAGQTLQAHDYLKKALELAPGDQELKLAYAEAALQAGRSDAVTLRGKKAGLRLHEIKGLRDPLLDREKVPENLYRKHKDAVAAAVEYPEDLVLPVEAVDGSIGHSKAVGFWAWCMADALDLHDQDRRDVLLAGYLLDVGKTIVPHHLLNRPGGLTKDEFAEVAKHSRESVRALRQAGYQTERVFDLIGAHHEAYSGSGYPAGLAGEAIPLGARLLAVADAYDAMTSWRPYRNRWNARVAFNELEKDTRAGKFDPKMTALLGRLLNVGAPGVLQS